MAKYPQRSCPKCDGYLGIVVPRAGDQWAMLEMQLSACVGCDSRETSAERAVRRLSGLIRGVEKIYGPSNLGQ